MGINQTRLLHAGEVIESGISAARAARQSGLGPVETVNKLMAGLQVGEFSSEALLELLGVAMIRLDAQHEDLEMLHRSYTWLHGEAQKRGLLSDD